METISSNLHLLQPAGKTREGYRGYSSPKRQDLGFTHTTSTRHEGPSRTCMGASSSRCDNTRLTNTQGRWLLLFHNPQGLQDSLEDPQDFRAEVNGIDFMFSWYLVRIYISQDQKSTETSTTEQFNFVMRYSIYLTEIQLSCGLRTAEN